MLVAHLVILPSCKTELGVPEMRDLEPVTKAVFDTATRATHLYFEGSRPFRPGDNAGWTIKFTNTTRRDKLDASFSLGRLIRIPYYLAEVHKITHGAYEAPMGLCVAFTSLPVFSAARNLWIRADTLWVYDRRIRSSCPALSDSRF